MGVGVASLPGLVLLRKRVRSGMEGLAEGSQSLSQQLETIVEEGLRDQAANGATHASRWSQKRMRQSRARYVS